MRQPNIHILDYSGPLTGSMPIPALGERANESGAVAFADTDTRAVDELWIACDESEERECAMLPEVKIARSHAVSVRYVRHDPTDAELHGLIQRASASARRKDSAHERVRARTERVGSQPAKTTQTNARARQTARAR